MSPRRPALMGANGSGEKVGRLSKDAAETPLDSRAQYYCARPEEFKLNNLSVRTPRALTTVEGRGSRSGV